MKTMTKTYGHNEGLSACFRQHAAESHCRFLHGYALSIEIEYACNDDNVDVRGWVYDFGGLKPLKAWIKDTFDHKTLVAADDPALNLFEEMSKEKRSGKLIDMLVLENGVGCENFAKLIFDQAKAFLAVEAQQRGVWVRRVTVREHPGNAASYVVETPGEFYAGT